MVLYALDGTDIALFFNLEFHCSNNKSMYEAQIIKLISTMQMKIRRLHVQGDSWLIIKQVTENS